MPRNRAMIFDCGIKIAAASCKKNIYNPFHLRNDINKIGDEEEFPRQKLACAIADEKIIKDLLHQHPMQ